MRILFMEIFLNLKGFSMNFIVFEDSSIDNNRYLENANNLILAFVLCYPSAYFLILILYFFSVKMWLILNNFNYCFNHFAKFTNEHLIIIIYFLNLKPSEVFIAMKRINTSSFVFSLNFFLLNSIKDYIS